MTHRALLIFFILRQERLCSVCTVSPQIKHSLCIPYEMYLSRFGRGGRQVLGYINLEPTLACPGKAASSWVNCKHRKYVAVYEIIKREDFLERFKVQPLSLHFKHVMFRIIVHIIYGQS